MTRWPRTWLLLTGEVPLAPAQQAAAEARARVVEAEQRGDDRSLGRAIMDLREAQHERLRLGQ